MRVEDRLRRAPAPDSAAARDRARRVVRSAPVAGPRRRRRPFVAGLLVVALGVALAPTGSAIASWLSGLVDPEPAPTAAPPPEPRLKALRAPGRVLVTGRGGAWIVTADGSRTRLGAYDDVAWSPRGLFVAAGAGRELRAIETDGTVRWAVTAPGAVRDPVWAPSGYRVAYRVGDRVRVVAGDGTGDRELAGDVAAIAPAWRPGAQHQLALARADGAVELWSADTRARLARVPPGTPPVALLWQGDRRLVIVRRHAIQVVGARGRVRLEVPVDGPVTAAARFGAGVALASGRTVSALPLPRSLRRAGRPRARLTAAGPVSDLVASPATTVLLVASAPAGQWVLLPVRRSGRVSAAEVEGVDRVVGWETEPLAAAPMGDGRQVVLTRMTGGPCLVLSGIDEFDRQCLYAPPSVPRLATGPVVQKTAGAPVEVYGTADAVVDRVEVTYTLDGRPAAQEAVLLRVRKGADMGRTRLARPFRVFVAELPSTARGPVATAYDAAGRVVGRDGFARIHPHAFLGTAGPGDLP